MSALVDPGMLALAVGASGVGSTALGGFVLWRERASLEACSLFGFTMVSGVWLLAFSSVYLAGDPETALARTRVAYLAVPLIPPAAFLFYRVMVGPLHEAIRPVVAAWLGGLAFVGVAAGGDHLLAGMHDYAWGYYPAYGAAGIPFLAFFIGILGKILWDLARACLREEPGDRRTRLAWMTIGFALACTGAVDFAPKYGVDVLPLGFASMLAFVVVGTGTVFRFPLVDASSRFTGDQVLQTMADPLLVCDRDGRIRLANRAVSEVLGFAPEALAGRSVGTLDLPEAAVGIEHIARGEGERDRELRVRGAHGEVVDVSLSSSRIVAPSGRWVGTVVILRDIRERKRLETHLHQLRKMEAIGRLAGGVAHDFNNILTAIRGHTQLLLDDVGRGSPLADELIEIDRSSMRAQQLTRQLLQFGRGQGGTPRRIDPVDVVSDMMSMLGRLLDGRVDLVVDAEPGTGPVEIDPTHLEQIVMNLVVNARDAMPGGGELLVKVRDETVRFAATEGVPGVEPGRWTVLVVSDTGTGMGPAVRERIFEPFFSTKAMGEGTGLGLATVYGILKRYGGHIEVVSRPGEGSRFTVWLPRVAEDRDEAAHRDEAVPRDREKVAERRVVPVATGADGPRGPAGPAAGSAARR